MIPIPRLELTAASVKLAIGIACALALALLVHDRNRWKAKTAHYAEMLAGERAAHAGTIAIYRAAAEQAREADRANAERVRARQAAISERTENDYETRLADARAAARRLRDQKPAAPAHSGPGRGTLVPELSLAADVAADATHQDRLPDADALIATEQAIQLDELIKWVERQAEVDAGSR